MATKDNKTTPVPLRDSRTGTFTDRNGNTTNAPGKPVPRDNVRVDPIYTSPTTSTVPPRKK